MLKKIAIICADGYEDLEMHYPRIRLWEAGHEVDVIGLTENLITGKNGYPYVPNLAIDEAKSEDYDGVIIPGGVQSPDYLRRDPKVLKFVAHFQAQNKMIAAICHGGWVLISAKVVKGKRATSYFAIKDDMINAGVDYIDEPVVVDGNLITSRMPADLPAFMKAILQYLEEH